MAKQLARPRHLAIQLFMAISQWPTLWRGVHGSMPCSNESYNWMNSVNEQSPCDMYAALIAMCGTHGCLSTTDVTPRTYLRARDQLQNPCFCNTVSYSLRAACELCIDVSLQTEQEYIAGQCNESFPQTFPCPLPLDVAIPGWAYQSVNDVFNVTLASQFVNYESVSPSTDPNHGHGSSGATSTTVAGSATQILPNSPSAPATAPQPSVQLTAISSSPLTLTQTNSLGKTTVPQTGGTPFESQPGSDASTSASFSQKMSASTSADISPSDYPDGPDQRASGNPDKLGPIAGGVAAAVSIALAVILATLLIRRRRRRVISICKDLPSLGDTNNERSSEPCLVPRDDKHWQPTGDEHTPAVQVPPFPLKLYDPDDPTTYPPSLSAILGESRTPTVPELRQIFGRPA
ncbi:hypothetical protein GY45DRAFT_1317995 [Cubamyces sp. BRFM 1775]|nr:hypothetical protein GY45DRAFT_1317995 [Cubamyces sp. BRFM 1775]